MTPHRPGHLGAQECHSQFRKLDHGQVERKVCIPGGARTSGVEARFRTPVCFRTLGESFLIEGHVSPTCETEGWDKRMAPSFLTDGNSFGSLGKQAPSRAADWPASGVRVTGGLETVIGLEGAPMPAPKGRPPRGRRRREEGRAGPAPLRPPRAWRAPARPWPGPAQPSQPGEPVTRAAGRPPPAPSAPRCSARRPCPHHHPRPPPARRSLPP